MLKIVEKLEDLRFRQLMDVYAESVLDNGQEHYPRLSENLQILEAEQDFYQYLRDCFFATEGAFYALWIQDDTYVSALRLEPYEDGLLLEALETGPDHRQRNYAKALIREVLHYVGDTKVYSHVHKKNIPSLRTHEACGFYRILEYARYIDGSFRENSCTFCSKQ